MGIVYFQDCEEAWSKSTQDSCRYHPNLFFRNFENFNLDIDVAHYTGLIKNPGKFLPFMTNKWLNFFQ